MITLAVNTNINAKEFLKNLLLRQLATEQLVDETASKQAKTGLQGREDVLFMSYASIIPGQYAFKP